MEANTVSESYRRRYKEKGRLRIRGSLQEKRLPYRQLLANGSHVDKLTIPS